MKNKNILSRFISYLKHYPYIMAGLIFSSIFSTIASVISPLLIGEVIDKIGTSSFLSFLLILSGAYIVYFVFNSLINYYLSKLASSLTSSMRKELFEKLHRLPISYFDNTLYGNIINTFSLDIDNLANGMIPALSRVFVGFTTAILALFFMFKLNLVMTILLVLCAPAMYYLSRFITKKSKKYFDERAKIVSSLSGYSEDILSHQKLVKDYNYETQSLEEFEKQNDKLYKVGKKAQLYSSLTNPSTRFISNLAYVIVGISGIIISLSGNITVGNISSFLLFTTLFTKPFQEITSMIGEIQQGLASSKRIFTFLDEKEESIDPNSFPLSSLQGDVKLNHVSFSYKKDVPFIFDLNLYIKKGENIAIVGQTGCGKTTLVNLLMRFYEINEGEILIDGIDIKTMPRKFLRDHIGMVLQDTKLFTGTVKENISYGKPNATDFEIKQAAKMAQADSFIKRLPQGYDTYLSSETLLSEGEIQLLTIARILLINPPIIILDEATSNVDLITESYIQQAILKVIKNSTSFIIAHRLSTILQADRILFMENGKIIEQGSHEELLAKKGKYYELYSSQYQG